MHAGLLLILYNLSFWGGRHSSASEAGLLSPQKTILTLTRHHRYTEKESIQGACVNPFICFDAVQFTYPPLEGDTDENGNQIIPKPVFYNFSAEFPAGAVHLTGPNASGKSTFMLLAAGRLHPERGSVRLFGSDTARLSPEQLQEYASFIYQNMEFETAQPAAELLAYVYANGFFSGNTPAIDSNTYRSLHEEVISVFELEPVLAHRLTELSKGEIQRVLLAFSFLYGSKSIFMDEPLFALEQYQKERALSYIRSYAKQKQVPIYLSMHELELTRRFAELVMLFYPDRTIDLGTPDEVLTQSALEKAYGVPLAMLKDAEKLTRENLKEAAAVLSAQ